MRHILKILTALLVPSITAGQSKSAQKSADTSDSSPNPTQPETARNKWDPTDDEKKEDPHFFVAYPRMTGSLIASDDEIGEQEGYNQNGKTFIRVRDGKRFRFMSEEERDKRESSRKELRRKKKQN